MTKPEGITQGQKPAAMTKGQLAKPRSGPTNDTLQHNHKTHDVYESAGHHSTVLFCAPNEDLPEGLHNGKYQ